MSTMSDVLAAVRDIMVAADATTEILKGERYLKQEGAANRVVFVIGDGTWNGAPKIGAKLVGAVSDSCTAYLWGVETVDDFTRDVAALVLRARLIAALHRVAPGRITPGAVRRSRDTNLLTYGEEYQVDFSYREDIGVIKSIANLPPDNSAIVGGTVVDGVITGGGLVHGVPTSPPDPLQPPGTPLSTVTVEITTNPESV